MVRSRQRRPILAIGICISALFIATAVLSLFWTPFSPARMQIAQRLKPPLEQGLFGTDQFGRDVASMLMAGAWNSLSIAAAAVAIGASLGSILGLAVSVRRGWLEVFTMRTCDVIFAVPPILSAMVLGAFIGAGRFTAIIAIATFMVPVFARLTLAAALQIWTRAYVLAAIGMGLSSLRITLVHVLPNISTQIIVQVTIQLGLAILTEAGLSFLGLGMAPPAPTWGRMLAEAQTFLGQAPWLAILPGLAIAFAVIGFSLLGDGLRDLLDPRSR
jgi:peptide/nickel transport system permease protein